MFAERSEHQRTGTLKTDENDFETTFKRIIAYDSKWGRRTRTFLESVPEFLVIYRYLSSKNLATRSEQQRTRTYKQTKNNDFKTTSERTSAYSSECQISPQNFPYAGVRWANSL